MKKRLTAALALFLLGAIAGAQESKIRTLKVVLNYTGNGKVDAGHKIFVFVFDTPDFAQPGSDSPPIASQTATARDETITVGNLTVSPVYLVAAFDPSGGYDGMSGPPPPGASIGLYGKEPGTPSPVSIDAGKTAQIELGFDDTVKIQ
jgi:hypothetical protein